MDPAMAIGCPLHPRTHANPRDATLDWKINKLLPFLQQLLYYPRPRIHLYVVAHAVSRSNCMPLTRIMLLPRNYSHIDFFLTTTQHTLTTPPGVLILSFPIFFLQHLPCCSSRSVYCIASFPSFVRFLLLGASQRLGMAPNTGNHIG